MLLYKLLYLNVHIGEKTENLIHIYPFHVWSTCSDLLIIGLSTGLMCLSALAAIKHQEPELQAPRGERSPGRWQKQVKGTRSYQVSF